MVEQTPELFRFERTITFDRSPQHVYEQWCDRGLWPAFTRPLCRSVGDNVLLMHRIPGEVVQWHTMDGAATPTACEAWFHQSDNGRSTELQLIVAWLEGHCGTQSGERLIDWSSEAPTTNEAAQCDLAHLLTAAVEQFQAELERELAVIHGAQLEASPEASREAMGSVVPSIASSRTEASERRTRAAESPRRREQQASGVSSWFRRLGGRRLAGAASHL